MIMELKDIFEVNNCIIVWNVSRETLWEGFYLSVTVSHISTYITLVK